jgi:hypothetical protein
MAPQQSQDCTTMTPVLNSGLFRDLAIEIDLDRSPVSVPAAEWLVCFVPGLRKQWWHRFANARHQHVFAIRMVDEDRWLLVEPWWTRMRVSALTLDEALKFLRWGAAGDILQVREAIPGHGTQVRGWSNCAVLIGFLLGRAYWTWTPHGLYCRLVAEHDARSVDLTHWLANHVRDIATRNADQAVAALETELYATRGQRMPPLSSSTSRPSQQEREKKQAHDHLISDSPIISGRPVVGGEIDPHGAGSKLGVIT